MHDQACEDLWFLNARVAIRRASADGPDRFGIMEHQISRGDSPPLHVHRDEDEIFHILEGEIRFKLGEVEVMARPGDTVVGPKRVPHTFRVESQSARMLIISTTGEFEGLVRDIARPAGPGLPPPMEPTPQALAEFDAACRRRGIELLGPPLAA